MSLSYKQQSYRYDTYKIIGLNGTFSPNHKHEIHRWYPYLEGFSKDFIEGLISTYIGSGKVMYDPFAGTGTSLVVASEYGLEGYYSEINPFMRLVIESKTNIAKNVQLSTTELYGYLSNILLYAKNNKVTAIKAKKIFQKVFANKEYFSSKNLIELISLKEAISKFPCDNQDFKKLALFILASIGVGSSELIRAGDLRYKKGQEKLNLSPSPFELFITKITMVMNDIPHLSVKGNVSCLSESSLATNSKSNFVDLVVTSPPYLNGTNYFRNTKIELWLAGFIDSSLDLTAYRSATMTAGINDISKLGRVPKIFSFVEEIANKLDKVAYDIRIPELVRRYSSDSVLWLQNIYTLMKEGAHAIVDIGDSKFCNVHIPTDELLITIAKNIGFQHIDTKLVRKRRSNDGSPLKQVLLIFRK